MHIANILESHPVSCSFEFFPPKTPAGAESLFRTIAALEPLRPAFVSVTYGAGGSTRDLTHELVVRIRRETKLEAIPHLTCVGHSTAELRSILDAYAEAGVDNVLALAGDPPQGAGTGEHDAFHFASELVAFARKLDQESARRRRGVAVAGYPEGHPRTPNRLQEMDYLKAKVDAGADVVITQLFFDNHDFYDFRERCILAGIHVPIIAGIMPVTSAAGLKRMSQLALGTRVPAALQRALSRCKDDAAVSQLGVHWATQQCLELLEHDVRGLHFYTLNRSSATLEIYKHLGVSDSDALAGPELVKLPNDYHDL